ncbi:MAG: CNNM domain-containing protein [Actinomycetota bacterium]
MLDIVLVVVFIALVALASFLSLAEVSLLRVQRVSLEADAEPGDTTVRRVLRLLDELPLVLNTVLLVVLFTQVTAAAVSGALASRWFGGLGVTIATFVVTMVLFVYAEVIPKTLALRAPDRSVRIVALPLQILVAVARPVTRALLFIANAHMPGAQDDEATVFTERELRMLTAEAAKAGEIDPTDLEFVERSFDFGDKRARDVLVPRDDVIVAERTMPVDDALELALAHGHRRLPVCEGGLQGILGVVRVRELMQAVRSDEPVDLESLLREVLRVRTDEPLVSILNRMQTSGARFAVVIAVNGEAEGIATVEDVVAELVGEIEEDD